MARTPETGIILDSSHMSASDLDLRIVMYAHDLGWPEPVNDERDLSYADAIRWGADRAVEWLNDHHAPEGAAYVVEDNSLYLWPIEDELGQGISLA